MRLHLAAATLLILAGCTVEPGPPGPPGGPSLPEPENDTCGAADYGFVLGQDATALERVLILDQVRVIRPGDAITMDFRAQRINFEIDAGNRIARIFCG